jgi:hypothetical protein
MGRSPSFGSTPCDSLALFRLAFAAAPRITRLTSPHRVTRRLILQEARRQTCPERHCPSTACKHAVSGSFNSPHRGPFHLSLTVLVHYRSPKVFSLGKWTPLLPAGLACPAVLKVCIQSQFAFAYEGLTRSARTFQPVRLANRFVTLSERCNVPDAPYNPHPATLAGYHTRWVWASPLSLATTQGILSLPGGT